MGLDLKKVKVANNHLKRDEEVLKLLKKVEPRTYEEMCLEKLKEIGVATASEWARAMGYNTHNALAKVIKRIKEEYPDQLLIVYNKKPRRYKAV